MKHVVVLLLLSSPAPLVAAAYAAQTVRRFLDDRRLRTCQLPAGPPIERIAAELRRLLWAHDRALRADAAPPVPRRLWTLETAIAHRATQAAGALGLTAPDRGAHGRYDRPQLCRLLRQLADEGLVLPPTVALMGH
jgi:hypothetical protein